MKQLFKICIVVIAALGAIACDSFGTLTGARKSAQGAPYEVLVVCNSKEWESDLGKELRKVLNTPLASVNQIEPMYDIYRVTANDFKGLLPAYRNILKVVCSPEVKECAILARYDVAASPQIVLTFQGPSQEAMVEYLDKNGDSLLRVLEIAERDRTVAYARKHGAKELEQLIATKFGIEISIPKGYLFRAEGDNFVWASHEYPVASQGFFIYTHPYTGKKSITVEALVKARNRFAKLIPGPSDGSYMTTVTRIPNVEDSGYTEVQPSYRALRINGRDWVELRGFWDVENDFMGGPFVSYTTLDKESGKLITLDCYVYSPKDGKRNYLRALEHLVYCVSPQAANNSK